MSAAFVDQLSALIVFAIISGFTPGPNNVMLLASGVNFGFRRTLPHIAGVSIGFPVMSAAVAIGLGAVFRTQPWLHTVIEAIGVVYLLWLAAKIAFQPVAGGVGEVEATARPLTFFQAAAFQWVNVKGWIMAISGVSVYVPDGLGTYGGAALIFVVYLFNGIASSSTWAGFGTVIARFLHDPLRLRLFNLTMGALLIASLAPAWVELFHWLAGRFG